MVTILEGLLVAVLAVILVIRFYLKNRKEKLVPKLESRSPFKIESRARQDEDMREIRTALNNNVRNMFITVIIGVGAMVVAVMMK